MRLGIDNKNKGKSKSKDIVCKYVCEEERNIRMSLILIGLSSYGG